MLVSMNANAALPSMRCELPRAMRGGSVCVYAWNSAVSR